MTSLSEKLAVDLRTARIFATSVPALTLTDPTIDVAAAYAIQWEGIQLRLKDGERIVGAKLGLTSRAKQQEVGFDRPIYAWLTDAMQVVGDKLAVDLMRAPRVEPELALVLGRDLVPAEETVASLFEAVAAVAPAIEVLDSRYPVNAPSLPDVIADGASAAAFVIGAPVIWDADEASLNDLQCQLIINGNLVATARAADTLGGPARALKALCEAVAAKGRALTAGSIILTGGLTRAFPIAAGDHVAVAFDDPVGTVTTTADAGLKLAAGQDDTPSKLKETDRAARAG